MSGTAPEAKLTKVLRTLLSFVLAVVVSTFSIALCFATSFLDASNIEKRLTSYEYVNGMRDNFVKYTECVYERNGLLKDNIDNIISYDDVKDVVNNYSGYYISERVGYEEDDYITLIDGICADIREDIVLQIKNTKQNNDSKAVDNVVKSINGYFASEVEINGAAHLPAVLNIGVPVSYAVMGGCVFIFVFVALILYFLGEKNRRYRSLRAISISFITAGIFDILLADIVLIISRIKTIDIYPVYLSQQFYNYLNNCIMIVIGAGLIIILFAIALAVLTWMNKTKGKR